MACFVVPMAQAIATTIIRKRNKSAIASSEASFFMNEITTLEKMLWGGTIMLIVDHAINGEISLSFPFFTALTEVGGFKVMLSEMLTVGVPMSLAISAAWFVMCIVKRSRVNSNVAR